MVRSVVCACGQVSLEDVQNASNMQPQSTFKAWLRELQSFEERKWMRHNRYTFVPHLLLPKSKKKKKRSREGGDAEDKEKTIAIQEVAREMLYSMRCPICYDVRPPTTPATCCMNGHFVHQQCMLKFMNAKAHEVPNLWGGSVWKCPSCNVFRHPLPLHMHPSQV